MENKNIRIATTSFLIIIVSTVEMQPLLKYPMLAIATLSFIILIVQLYNEYKSTLAAKQKNND